MIWTAATRTSRWISSSTTTATRWISARGTPPGYARSSRPSSRPHAAPAAPRLPAADAARSLPARLGQVRTPQPSVNGQARPHSARGPSVSAGTASRTHRPRSHRRRTRGPPATRQRALRWRSRRLGRRDDGSPGLAVGGVEEDVGELLVGEAAVAERADFLVEVRADPADFGLADAGVRAQGFDGSS